MRIYREPFDFVNDGGEKIIFDLSNNIGALEEALLTNHRHRTNPTKLMNPSVLQN